MILIGVVMASTVLLEVCFSMSDGYLLVIYILD